MRRVLMFTDGSHCPNTRRGGWAFIYLGHRGEEVQATGGEDLTTSSRMELAAVVEGLESLTYPHEVLVYTDCQPLTLAVPALGGWEAAGWVRKGRPVKDSDLWSRLRKQLGFHQVEFKWIRAHGLNALNSRVDLLARQARESGVVGVDGGTLCAKPSTPRPVGS